MRHLTPVCLIIIFISMALTACNEDEVPGAEIIPQESFMVQWSRLLSGPSDEDEIDAVASDQFGNVYVSGKFEDSLTVSGDSQNLISVAKADIMIVKYNAAGDWQWTRRFGGSGEDNIFDAVCDSDGNLILSGYFENTVDFGGNSLTAIGATDMVLMKMSPEGDVIWAKQFGGSDRDGGNEVEVGDNNQIIVGAQSEGTFEGLANTGSQDAYVMSITTDGNLQWLKSIQGQGAARAKAIEVDAMGNVYMGGDYLGPNGLNANGSAFVFESYGKRDAYLASWSATGDFRWAKTWGGIGNELCKGVSITSQNEIYSVGEFEETVDFDGTPLTSKGARDLYIWKLNNNGEAQWLRHIASSSNTTGTETAIDANDNLVFGLGLNGPTEFPSAADTLILNPTGVVRSPVLIRYDSDGNLDNHLMTTQSEGNSRFGELSVSNQTVYFDCDITDGPHTIGSETYTSVNSGKDAVVVAIKID